MVEQVLIVTGVMGLLFMVATGAAAVFVVRRVRRRYRAARARLMTPRGWQSDVQRLLRHSGSVAVASVGSPRWWAVQNRRHRMWRAVTSAEHAVRIARRADVAVGELPALADRLRAAANGVDGVLRASERGGSLRQEDRQDCDRIELAASELRDAALASMRSDSHADTDTVVSAVRIEVAALAAGVRAAHG
ncbi:MAG: hypothetical protein J2P22_04380 [Nocardioides sp.]|nr:hypothetical protein [Nocardioides sp.]